MDSPLISVIVPTYNRADLLPRTIDSVFNQTIEDFELIIVDDGSTDNTQSVVRSYTDDRLIYIQFAENQGANAARNAGIQNATAQYVSFLDSDDKFTQTHLEVVVSHLENHPRQVGGVYTSQRFIEGGKEVDQFIARDKFTDPQQVLRDYQAGGFPGWTFRSTVFDDVGMLDESLEGLQDREFLIRFLEQYDFAPVSEILVSDYYHDDRMSANPTRKLSALEKVIDKHRDRFGPKEWAYVHYYRGFLQARCGDFGSARRSFYAAVKNNPTKPRYYLQLFASLFGADGFNKINEVKRKAKLKAIAIRRNS
jgi:glycosyltransferase involved in cell wall biosynthesis